MPRIPIYQDTTDVNVLPNGMSHVDSPVIAFDKSVTGRAMQGFGNAAEGLGKQIFQYAIQKANEDNLLVAKNAIISANDKVRSFMDDDILKRQGLAADNAVTDADSSLAEIYKDSVKNLNPKQKEIFDFQFASMRTGSLHSAATHRRYQMDAADRAADEALFEGYIKNSLSDYTNNANYETNLKEGSSLAVASIKKRTGADISPEAMVNLPPEEQTRRKALYSAGVGDFKNRYHASIINQAIADGNLDWARKDFDKYKSDFNPETRAKLESYLKTRIDLKSAQSFSDEMLTKYGLEGEAKAFEEIPAKFTGEQRELVERQVKASFYDARRLKLQGEADRAEDLMKQVLSTSTKAEALSIAETAKDNPDVYVKVHQFLNAKYGTDKKGFDPAAYEKLESAYKAFSDGKIDKGTMLQVFSDCSAVLPERYTSHIWANIEEVKKPESYKKSYAYKAGSDLIEKAYKDKKLYTDPAGLWNKRSSPEDQAVNKANLEQAYDAFFSANPGATADQAVQFVKEGTKAIQDDTSVALFANAFAPKSTTVKQEEKPIQQAPGTPMKIMPGTKKNYKGKIYEFTGGDYRDAANWKEVK